MTARIGLIGGRGYTGREILRHLSWRTDMELVLASSRELAGQPVTATAPELKSDLLFKAISPRDLAGQALDAVILALPNGAGAPFVEAVSPETVIVDLSADYRFAPDWVYGLPEIYGREPLKGAKRIANPGCYATCGQLAIAPVRTLLSGSAHVFGVSGYSGAGTTPSRKNDAAALKDNLIPYALTGHIHEQEMAHHLGRPVRFSPHVAPFFSGLITTVQMTLAEPSDLETLREIYETAYADEALLSLNDVAPEPAQISGQPGSMIGGFSLGEDGRAFTVVSALDNLQKGAAVQALQNLSLALDLPEGRYENTPA
ncbi:N-acetyl-gamma-glutamyl-phosphate reductase [Hyphobacterium sp.]|uniref:N-acetyl-gamma-glutamyl-phosphate reductase n=1 Tax=Hyphobacterium sp. TaxID=2004662 RepID=UPI003BAC80F2